MVMDEGGPYGAEKPRFMRSNAGMIVRGDTRAIDEFLVGMAQQAELLGVSVVYVKRSGSWLSIVDGRPHTTETDICK